MDEWADERTSGVSVRCERLIEMKRARWRTTRGKVWRDGQWSASNGEKIEKPRCKGKKKDWTTHIAMKVVNERWKTGKVGWTRPNRPKEAVWSTKERENKERKAKEQKISLSVVLVNDGSKMKRKEGKRVLWKQFFWKEERKKKKKRWWVIESSQFQVGSSLVSDRADTARDRLGKAQPKIQSQKWHKKWIKY